MNWEESRALTPLKHDFLVPFFARMPQFFLTGGSALGIFYLEHRLSYDLDFFTTAEHVDWHVLDNELLAIANQIEADCSSITVSPTFRRYELRRKDEREILDFVIEFTPQIDSEKQVIGGLHVDTLREITVNKICTLAGRSELKDIVDLYFLDQHGYHVADHFEEARQKEGGLDPAMMSYLLENLPIQEVPEYVLKSVDVDALRQFKECLRKLLAEMAFPE